MKSETEEIGGLQVPPSNRRRLSLVQNDDCFFQSCKQNKRKGSRIKETKSNEFAPSQQKESVIFNALKEVNDIVIAVPTKTDGNAEDYHPIWKYSDNQSIMRYRWLRTLRTKIMRDLTRHFGREVMHDRLFSCLCKSHDVLAI